MLYNHLLDINKMVYFQMMVPDFFHKYRDREKERETYHQVTASHAVMKAGRAERELYIQTQPSWK